MNKDQVEGKAKEIIGNVKKQAGYWTDDKQVEAKGAILQVEGVAQKAWGDLKEVMDRAEDKLNSTQRSRAPDNKKNHEVD